MSDSRAHIVTGLLRDGDRLLLVHRSPNRLRYPNVWDLPGGHVEPGEPPAAALVRELREELGIEVPQPADPPLDELRSDTFFMQIWLIEAWTGTPVNTAPEEHDAIGWFTGDEIRRLRLALDDSLALFTKALGTPPTGGAHIG
ncbi:NUDIX domain-containing protein [Dactylosporangium sp. CS-047395]|uniref:NUDIX domain-containing protein n=1 Tax=Dactylosporangium sp. CS-047395 TaxID=3239936 RepID=UPI003D8AAA54